MDYTMNVVRIKIELPALYFKGPQVGIHKFSIFANIAYPDAMPQYVWGRRDPYTNFNIGIYSTCAIMKIYENPFCNCIAEIHVRKQWKML